MSPENSAQPECDEPLDAIVYDVHPALLPQPIYPYGRRNPDAQFGNGDNPFQAFVSFQGPSAARYKVPKTFGMSAILGITTALALLFGGLRLLNADPLIYLFFGMQGLAICIVQMFHGQTPRFASSVAGAIILPLFVMCVAAFSRYGPNLLGTLCLMVIAIPIGAFQGYLTGTCAAGIFLVMDALEPYLQGRRPASAASSQGAGG